MAYTFFKAKGISVGKSLVDEEGIAFSKMILEKYPDKIILPIDHVVSTSMEDKESRNIRIEDTKDNEMGFDIGDETIALFCSILKDAKRVIINGPMGLFENTMYQKGTKNIYKFITDNNIKTLIGGGDSASSVNKLSNPSLFYHISTGGGATLEYLEGKNLPGIEAINEK